MANQTTPAIQIKDSNVGIGTDSPLYKLNVIGDISFPSRNTAGTYRIGMGREDGSGWTYTQNIAFISDGGGGYITFSTQQPGVGGGEFMRLNYTGNLLIGTTTDSGYKLAVNGSAGLALSSGGIVVASYDGNTGNIKPSVGNGSVLISDDSGTTGRGTEFLNNGGLIASSTQSVVASFNSSVTDGLGWIKVNTTQQTTASGTSPAAIELVGLRGTSTHGRHAFIGAEGVDGTTWRTQVKFKIRAEDSPYEWSTLPTQMVIDGNGNVGIGTTDPSTRLQVLSSQTNSSIRTGGLEMQSYDVNNSWYAENLYFDGGSWRLRSTGFATQMYMQNGTIDFNRVATGAGGSAATLLTTMRLFSNGNVLIGTTTDSGYKLAVNGKAVFGTGQSLEIGNAAANPTDAGISYGIFHQSGVGLGIASGAGGSTQGIQIWSHDGSNFFPSVKITGSTGNVGIGTTTPTSRLQVAGSTSLYNGAAGTGAISAGTQEVITTGFNLGPSETLALSTIGLASATSWKAIVMGGFANNIEGGGLVSPGLEIEVDSDNPTIDVGSTDITFSRNSSTGLLQVTNGNATYRVTFVGAIRIVDYPQSVKPTISKVMLKNVGIGTTAPSAYLDVKGLADTAGVISLQLRSGNTSANFNSNQITLGYANTADYRHAIKSRHNSGAGAGNAIDFYIWNNSLNASDIATNPIMSIDTTNVGIGTTVPTEKLHVDGSTLITYNNSFQSTNSVNNKAILARVSPTSGIVNYAEYATATNLNGFVIGSDDARVKGNIATDSLEFITNTSTRMTILSGGNVGINTTVPGSTLHVVGDVLIQTGALGVGVSPNATDGRIDASNDIVAFSTSDKRLKENITPIANALEKVRSLTGVEFDWKEETKSVHGYEGHDVGVIAQDVQAVLPEAVRTNDSGYLSVRYEKMIALLVEAMKEQQAQIEELKKLIK